MKRRIRSRSVTGVILARNQTNVGRQPNLPGLAAVVTDIGAPLPHTTIVARAPGIPAVVDRSNATMRLRTGDRVCVGGGRGTVVLFHT